MVTWGAWPKPPSYPVAPPSQHPTKNRRTTPSFEDTSPPKNLKIILIYYYFFLCFSMNWTLENEFFTIKNLFSSLFQFCSSHLKFWFCPQFQLTFRAVIIIKNKK
jgi:hypothetical protein